MHSSQLLLSVQLVNCPMEWTQSDIEEIFHINHIGRVRNVVFVPRANNGRSAYIDMYYWYATENSGDMVNMVTRGKCLQVAFSSDPNAMVYIFKNVPSRAKKTAYLKLMCQKKREARQDVIDFDEMLKETRALIAAEQEQEQEQEYETVYYVSGYSM